MAEDKSTIDDMWLSVLTGHDDADVSGQFLNKEQAEALEEAELLREALLVLNEKEHSQTDDFDVKKSAAKLIEKLKKDTLL